MVTKQKRYAGGLEGVSGTLYVSIGRIFNMLSIIVQYYFCVQSTYKPVMTPTLSAQEIPCRLHYKKLSEILNIFHKCQKHLGSCRVHTWFTRPPSNCQK